MSDWLRIESLADLEQMIEQARKEYARCQDADRVMWVRFSHHAPEFPPSASDVPQVVSRA